MCSHGLCQCIGRQRGLLVLGCPDTAVQMQVRQKAEEIAAQLKREDGAANGVAAFHRSWPQACAP